MRNKKSGKKTCLKRFIQHPHWKLTRAVANEFSEKRKPWDAQLNFATGLLLCYLKEKIIKRSSIVLCTGNTFPILVTSSLLQINTRYSKLCLINQYSQYQRGTWETDTSNPRRSAKFVLSQETRSERTELIRNTSCFMRSILFWILANHFLTQVQSMWHTIMFT